MILHPLQCQQCTLDLPHAFSKSEVPHQQIRTQRSGLTFLLSDPALSEGCLLSATINQDPIQFNRCTKILWHHLQQKHRCSSWYTIVVCQPVYKLAGVLPITSTLQNPDVRKVGQRYEIFFPSEDKKMSLFFYVIPKNEVNSLRGKNNFLSLQ